MKDIERMFDEAVAIVKECIDGVKIRPINRPIIINTRAKTRLGRCSFNRRTGWCRLEVSSMILRDEVPYDAAMSTVIHEILHACKGCEGHTGLWLEYAGMINRKYPQYNIKRTADLADYGLKEEYEKRRRKYAIRCKGCGKVHYSSRLSETIKHPEYYSCVRCGGIFERINVSDVDTPKPKMPQLDGGRQLSFADF